MIATSGRHHMYFPVHSFPSPPLPYSELQRTVRRQHQRLQDQRKQTENMVSEYITRLLSHLRACGHCLVDVDVNDSRASVMYGCATRTSITVQKPGEPRMCKQWIPGAHFPNHQAPGTASVHVHYHCTAISVCVCILQPRAEQKNYPGHGESTRRQAVTPQSTAPPLLALAPSPLPCEFIAS